MKLDFSAGSAVLFKLQLFFHVELVPLGKIVLALTDGTNQGDKFSGSFFGHSEPGIGIEPMTLPLPRARSTN